MLLLLLVCIVADDSEAGTVGQINFAGAGPIDVSEEGLRFPFGGEVKVTAQSENYTGHAYQLGYIEDYFAGGVLRLRLPDGYDNVLEFSAYSGNDFDVSFLAGTVSYLDDNLLPASLSISHEAGKTYHGTLFVGESVTVGENVNTAMALVAFSLIAFCLGWSFTS